MISLQHAVGALATGLLIGAGTLMLAHYVTRRRWAKTMLNFLKPSKASGSNTGLTMRLAKVASKWQPVFSGWASGLVFGAYRDWLLQKLREAGNYSNQALQILLASKFLYASAGITLGSFLAIKFGLLAAIAAGLVGFFGPDFGLLAKVQRRAAAIDANLPEAIDLLNLCTAAGLQIDAAISRVALSAVGELSQEFGILASQLQLGISRSDALSQLANRSASRALGNFAQNINQTEQLGVPIAKILEEQAQNLRDIRRDNAREAGQKVAVKVLLPLLFCFLPAVFVIVLGPALVQLGAAINTL